MPAQDAFRREFQMEIVKFFLKHSRSTVVLGLVAGIFSGACNAALLAVINALLKHGGFSSMKLVLAFVGLCFTLPLSRFTSEILLNNLGQDSLYSLRVQISRQALAAPLRHLEQIGAHCVMAVLTDDLPMIANTALILPLLCLNATVVLGCLLFIGLLSWKMLGIISVFMAVGIAGYQFPALRAQAIFRKARKDGNTLLKHFQALLYGSKELKLHRDRRNAFFARLLDATASSFRDHNKTAMKVYTASATWGQTLVFVVVGLIVLVFPTSQGLSREALTGCTLALLYLMMPLQVIMNMAPTLARANVAVKNVRELGFQLSLEKDTAPDEAHGTARENWRTLQFKAVMHSYRREDDLENFSLGPINVHFLRGELVFITGGNGSGKTTFVKLLTGLYAPEQGEVSIDGRIDTAHPQQREEYREHFSAVFSDFFLFDQLLGLSDTVIADSADGYLKQLKLDHKVKVEKGTLSTTELSQGQRKRLALLTAYLEDRSIYVFDEWAADQDPYFKEIFYLQFLPELKARGKTAFVISHDDRYYHVADRIIKFDEGQIVSDQREEPVREKLALTGIIDRTASAERNHF
jgi:putative ATP-binding cassette transporter